MAIIPDLQFKEHGTLYIRKFPYERDVDSLPALSHIKIKKAGSRLQKLDP